MMFCSCPKKCVAGSFPCVENSSDYMNACKILVCKHWKSQKWSKSFFTSKEKWKISQSYQQKVFALVSLISFKVEYLTRNEKNSHFLANLTKIFQISISQGRNLLFWHVFFLKHVSISATWIQYLKELTKKEKWINLKLLNFSFSLVNLQHFTTPWIYIF